MLPYTFQYAWPRRWYRRMVRHAAISVSLAAGLGSFAGALGSALGEAPPARHTYARQAAPRAAGSSRPSSYVPLQHWNAAHGEESSAAAKPNATAKPNAAAKVNRSVPQPSAAAPSQASSVSPSGYTAAGASEVKVVNAVRQEPGDDADNAAEMPNPLERLPDVPGGRMPGSRTAAETVEAPAVLPEGDEVFIIDLPMAMRLLVTANPTVANARELVQETLALQTKARIMLLPSLNGGTAYHHHLGNFQASTGQIKNIFTSSLYYGAGSRVWAAESLAVPGVRIFAHLGDAYFEPLAVRQQLAMRRFDVAATANTLVLEAIIRYFDLLGAEGRYEAARQSEREAAEIVRITASYARTGQGREGDANRARSEAYLMHVEVQRAEERIAVASTRLAELLSLDPAVRLRTVGGPIAGIEIIDPEVDVQTLMRIAERRRPELAAGSANVEHNSVRVRQEKMRPFFPMVLLGYSAGSYGGGGVLFPPALSNFRGRSDFDALAIWSLTNMGVGNAATVSERRAVLNQAIADRTRALNGIRQEVFAAYGLVKGEQYQIQITQRQLADSEEGFREEFARLLGAEGLPIEVLNSVAQLGFSRQELIKAVIGYNQGQFRLFVATGTSPIRAKLPPSDSTQPTGRQPVNQATNSGMPQPPRDVAG